MRWKQTENPRIYKGEIIARREIFGIAIAVGESGVAAPLRLKKIRTRRRNVTDHRNENG